MKSPETDLSFYVRREGYQVSLEIQSKTGTLICMNDVPEEVDGKKVDWRKISYSLDPEKGIAYGYFIDNESET